MTFTSDNEPGEPVRLLVDDFDHDRPFLHRGPTGWRWSDSRTDATANRAEKWDSWVVASSAANGGLRDITPVENPPADFITLDSGTRATFPSGMQRDTQSGKPRYDLIPIWFLRELAELMARGAEKYGDRNWEQANSPEEVARMDASGLRHHFQYLEGDRRENHLAATVFNLFAAEDTRRKVGPND